MEPVAVAAHVRDARARDAQREVDQAPVGAARHRKLVEREERPRAVGLLPVGVVAPRIALALAHHVDAQVGALLAHALVGERRGDDRDHAVIARVRQKAQPAEVDPQDRNARRADLTRRAQDRPVAAQHDRQVDAALHKSAHLADLGRPHQVAGIHQRAFDTLHAQIGAEQKRRLRGLRIGVIAYDEHVHADPLSPFDMMKIIAKPPIEESVRHA